MPLRLYSDMLLYLAHTRVSRMIPRGVTLWPYVPDTTSSEAKQHPRSNLGVGISEGCFIFHFASLPLEVARPI